MTLNLLVTIIAIVGLIVSAAALAFCVHKKNARLIRMWIQIIFFNAAILLFRALTNNLA
jgi:ABC-type multidrug transport system permease subunit